MAGIRAVSVTKTFASAGADVASSGFLINEQIVLSAEPAGAGYAWKLSAPSNSVPARSRLDDDGAAVPTFTPDVDGLYLVQVVVDGTTTYVLRIGVSPVASAKQAQAINFLPLADSQVPTPILGRTIYCSATQGNVMVEKRTDGSVHIINVT